MRIAIAAVVSSTAVWVAVASEPVPGALPAASGACAAVVRQAAPAHPPAPAARPCAVAAR